MYSSARLRGGHIVAELLPYRDRSDEAERVVRALKSRCADRVGVEDPRDKTLNPLITIPGSPGSGKSTFFAHFPESTAFQTFLGSRSPIVSTLTYNSGMDGGPASIGLRILFGAVRAMGLADDLTWKGFSKDLEDIQAVDAVQLLRRVFGEDRPVLVLVDELSKAEGYDGTAMTQLGELLNSDGDAHVVVSSLSPAYITSLLSGSQRRVVYVVLSPLDTCDLGQPECKVWAETFITPVTDTFKANLLRSAYLLASGHPRSLEELVKAFTSSDSSRWASVRREMRDGSVPSVLRALALETSLVSPSIQKQLDRDALELVLSCKLIKVDTTEAPTAALFRDLLEKGAIFVCRGQGSQFSPAVTGSSIVHVVESLQSSTEQFGPRAQAAKVLFQNLVDRVIADWWERCVDLTMVCRSFDGATTHQVFGIETAGLRTFSAPLTVRKADTADDLKVANANELLVSPPGHKGYDSRATVAGAWFYNQMKIDQPKMPAAKVRARTIASIIDEHSAFFPSDTDLSRVHVSFYEWGNDGSYIPSQQDVLEALAGLNGDQGIANKYVQDHWQNVHTVTRPMLIDWLVPSLLSIPRLATALYVDATPSGTSV